MQITDIEALHLRGPEPADYPHPVASFVQDGFAVLRVMTDEGITGVGEPSPYVAPHDVELAVMKALKPRFLGEDPFDVRSLTRPGVPRDRDWRCEASGHAAVAGFSHALWDIVGKAVGKPVWQLLNPSLSRSPRIEAYASGGMIFEWEDDALVVDEAVRAKEAGYRSFKLRPALPARASHQQRSRTPPPIDMPRLLRLLTAVRTRVDPMHVMVDAGCRLASGREAARLIAAMADLGCTLLEEPLPRVMADYASLARVSPVSIAGGESLATAGDFEAWIDAGSYDVIQPDGNLAGIPEVAAIAEMAWAKGVPIVMHNWANDVSIAANVHLGAALAACDLVESNVTLNPLRERLVNRPYVVTEGWFELRDEPGLGIELNEDVVQHYRVN